MSAEPHWEVQVFTGERKGKKLERRWACAFLLFGTSLQIRKWKHQVLAEGDGITALDALQALLNETKEYLKHEGVNMPNGALEAIRLALHEERETE